MVWSVHYFRKLILHRMDSLGENSFAEDDNAFVLNNSSVVGHGPCKLSIVFAFFLFLDGGILLK